MLPHLADRPLNLQRFPNGAGAPGFWQKDIPVERAQVAHDLARDRLPRARGPGGERPPGRRPRGGAVLAGQPGVVRDPRLDLDHRGAVDADVRADRHRPGHEDDLGRDPRRSPGCTGRPSSTSASAPTPSSPAAAASRPGSRSSAAATSTRTRAPGSRSCRGPIGGDGAQARVVGVGEGRSRRQGAPRLHPERGDQDARRAVRRPPAAGRPGLRADPLGGARRPDLRPDRWTIATLPARVAEVGDLWAGMQEDHQVLPAL